MHSNFRFLAEHSPLLAQLGATAEKLYPFDPAQKFEPAQFAQAKVAIMGNQGALAAGFDAEVDITRLETDYLQRRLIDWRKARQASGAAQKK